MDRLHRGEGLGMISGAFCDHRPETCPDRACPWFFRLRRPSFQEWLETDGLGGFSSSTSYGIHTRRYHGWLFMSGKNPGDRWLFLSKVEERVRTRDGTWELGSNLYPGVLHPRGTDFLWGWELRPHPVFLYKAGPVFLEREIFMVKGTPGVFVAYRLLAGPEEVELSLRPLVNSRFYHNLAREGGWNPEISPVTGDDPASGPAWVVLEPHAIGEPVTVWTSRGSFRKECVWYRSMLYPREEERGLDFGEDHLCPGEFRIRLRPPEVVYLWAGPLGRLPPETVLRDGVRPEAALDEVKRRETRRRLDVCREGSGGLRGRLFLAADSFIVRTRSGEPTIIAGYHWFGEWGRDAFISLPGLLLTSGRYEEARGVLLRFSAFLKHGLIPNFVGEDPAYNSVDASLWFVVALGKYLALAGERRTLAELYPAVKDIVRSFTRGTMYGIAAGPCGLVRAGTPDSQVTWMDAKVGETPVTPRDGYAVEVNSLWLTSLSLVSDWAYRMADTGFAGEVGRLRASAQREFLRRFTWPGVGLYDRLLFDGTPVPEVRPNAVIAGSLQGFPGDRGALKEVMCTASKLLLTPYGLRTLSPDAPGYAGRYWGGSAERDRAYHQGTAWPWLLGPLVDVRRKLLAGLDPEQRRDAISRLCHFLLGRLADLDSHPCAGTVFEVCSGDPPYTPGGTVAQAWSVAEMLRVIHGLQSGRWV